MNKLNGFTNGGNLMKKSLLVSSAAALLLSLSAVAPLAVSAAGDAATGTTTAEFEVTGTDENTNPGGNQGTEDQAGLWLVKAPDVHFASVKLADLIKGNVTTDWDSNTVTNQTGDKPENADGALQVSDLRGTSAGWNLTASVDQPTNGTTPLNGTLVLGFNNAVADNLTATPATGASLSTDGTPATIWSAAANSGQGDNTAAIDTAATKFTLNKDAAASKGVYDATVTWTLMSGPAAD